MSRHLSARNISSKSMHAFLSNLANRQTDKRGQTHLPPSLSEVISSARYSTVLCVRLAKQLMTLFTSVTTVAFNFSPLSLFSLLRFRRYVFSGWRAEKVCSGVAVDAGATTAIFSSALIVGQTCLSRCPFTTIVKAPPKYVDVVSVCREQTDMLMNMMRSVEEIWL